MSTARRCAASSLSALGAVFLLRSCGAFVVPPIGSGTRGAPGNKATGHGSAFGGVGLGWKKTADMTALPGRALGGTSSSFVPDEGLVGNHREEEEEEEKEARRAAMASALVDMKKHEGGGAGGGGGGGSGGREEGRRWRNGFRKVRGAVARVWTRGDSPRAAGGEDQQLKAEKEEAGISAAAASPLVSHELPPSGRMGAPGIVKADTGDVPRLLRGMLGDDGFDRQQRVVILTSDTGRGHYAAAEALREGLHQIYPFMVNVDVVDIWSQHAPLLRHLFMGLLRSMAERSPVWKALWELSRFPPARKVLDELTNIRCHERFRSVFQDSKPDLVVSVHPLCQQVPLRVLREMGGGSRKIPFVTVVTDLAGAHPTWFHRDVDACFVPSERLAILARKCGLAPDQVRLRGLPIRPGFRREQSAKTELQEELGLMPGVKTCLVVGKGDGDGELEGIVASLGRRLGQSNGEYQVVVACRGNRAVKASLEGMNWAPNVHVHLKDYVSNMDEWMGAVDCIVTRAGSVIVAEAMVRGLPIMLSGFSPGQEDGNVPFVVEGGFGAYRKDPAKIADEISDWLEDNDLLAKMSSKAKQASRPLATDEICGDIKEMLVYREESLEVPGRCNLVIDTFTVD